MAEAAEVSAEAGVVAVIVEIAGAEDAGVRPSVRLFLAATHGIRTMSCSLTRLFGASLFVLVSHVSADQNWHAWRGSDATGVSKTGAPPIEWSEDKNVRWKVPIDGYGSSTAIVWEDKVFLTTAINTGKVDPSKPRPEDQPERVFGIKHPNTEYEFVVLCLDRATGKERWRKSATRRVPHEGHHDDNNFASASPTTDGERLYCWFGSAGLFCYNFDGEKLWERDLGEAKTVASLGEGCSPVVHDGRLIIVRDHRGQSSIQAFDAASGTPLWKKDRDETNTWATPAIVEHDGITQVITSGEKKVRSYDLEDGRIIWQCGGLSQNAIPCPVVADGLVYCMSGYKGYSLLALPISAEGDITGSDQIAWSKNKGTPYIPSPLLYDGLLYYMQSNQNLLSCADAKTGEIYIERERLPGMANVYASPVGAGGRVYITGRNGKTLVLERSKKLTVLATNKLDDSFHSSAAIAGDAIFLRGRKSLYCIAPKG
jgi:outer membrane protein assembly factor BamB